MWDKERPDRNVGHDNGDITVFKCMLINGRSIVGKREEMDCVVDTTVGVCYNTTADNQKQQKSLHELLEKSSRVKGEQVIRGDFNHRIIDWNQLEAEAEGPLFT